MIPERLKRRTPPLLLLLVLAAAPRIALALKPGLWADEVFSLAMATGHSLEHPAAAADSARGDYVEPAGPVLPERFRRYARHDTPPAGAARVVRAVFLSDTSPPLYYLLLGAWTRVAGTGDAALRLFSAFWALASLPLVWAVGRRLGGRRVAWIAAALFALSPPGLYYSAEGRMYSLLWFLALALAWLTLALTRRGARAPLAALWALAGAAGLLTHYFFAFVWLACAGWLLLRPGRLRRGHLLAIAAASGALVLPWYVRVPESLAGWRVTAGWQDLALTPGAALIAPGRLAWSLFNASGPWGGARHANYVFVAVLLLAAGVALPRAGLGRWFRGARLLPWLWAAGAIVGVVAFDVLRGTQASLIPRYVLPGLPAALLLLALLLGLLPAPARLLATLLVLAAWTLPARVMLARPARPWQPYPRVAESVQRSLGPGDLLVVHSIPSGVIGVARYLREELPMLSWVPQLQRRDTAALAAAVAGRCRVDLVKVQYLDIPSPAEAWLRAHATLVRADTLTDPVPGFTEVVHFRLCPPAGRSATDCPATSRPGASAPDSCRPPGSRTRSD